MDEQSIVLRCQQGETKLLDQLVRLHADSLHRFCYHLSGNADSAAELFQDTWVKALKNINQCKANGTILGWLFTIAANIHKDRYRRHKRWQILSRKPQLALPTDSMDERLVNLEQRVLIRQEINKLDDSQRIPLILFYFEDYSVDAIAKILEVPEGTVKSRLYRARKHLKNRLEVLK